MQPVDKPSDGNGKPSPHWFQCGGLERAASTSSPTDNTPPPTAANGRAADVREERGAGHGRENSCGVRRADTATPCSDPAHPAASVPLGRKAAGHGRGGGGGGHQGDNGGCAANGFAGGSPLPLSPAGARCPAGGELGLGPAASAGRHPGPGPALCAVRVPACFGSVQPAAARRAPVTTCGRQPFCLQPAGRQQHGWRRWRQRLRALSRVHLPQLEEACCLGNSQYQLYNA